MNWDLLDIERIQFNELRDSVGYDRFSEIHHEFIIKYTFDILQLRNKNELTLDDVEKIINGFEIKKAISELAIKEVVNHYNAYQFMYQKILQRKKIDEDLIKDIHEVLTEGISNGGSYRQVNVIIAGSTHQPPDYVKVYDRMKKMFFDLEYFAGSAVQKAAFIVGTLLKIHPFVSYNTTLAILVMNYIILYDGYISISIDENVSDDFLLAVDDFKVNKKMQGLEIIIKKQLLSLYDKWIKKLE